MVVDTFIRRPILASVCSLVIILAGAAAIPTLPIAQFPQLAPPTVTVSTFYQGASAEIVESAVTLTKALRRDIQALGVRLQSAASTEEREKSTEKKGNAHHDQDEAGEEIGAQPAKDTVVMGRRAG